MCSNTSFHKDKLLYIFPEYNLQHIFKLFKHSRVIMSVAEPDIERFSNER